ncbi:MAG: hypothetical protein K0R46_894 [Herbinix sp.]|jgi:uncharacterized protein YbaP (TraB family)|nr:hypothetical protein [Herbinix sp.]
MKKRILALLLAIILCMAVVLPAQSTLVQAAEAGGQIMSPWAMSDLVVGETYGIFPATWAEKSMTTSITQAKFSVLLAGLRHKLLATDEITERNDARPKLDSSLSVEEVVKAYYVILSNYDYPVDLGMNNGLSAVAYMKKIGIYTGANGEQSLKDRCSIEQAIALATRIVTYLYEAVGASSKGFLWEVKSGENTIYLLGSIHLASSRIYPFSSKIWQAYLSSDALIVEADIYNQQELQAMNALVMYMDGTTLKDHVSAECYEKAVRTAKLLGITEAQVALVKPWYLSSVMENYLLAGTVDADKLVSALGIDRTFINQAYLYQKPLAQIEGLTKQIQIIDGFSPELQEFMLMDYIDRLDEFLAGTENKEELSTNEYANLLLQYWHEGNVEEFGKIYSEDDLSEAAEDAKLQKLMAEYKDKLMVQRDNGMADYINNLLKTEGSNTYFVVVGAGHFISDNDVIDRLEDKGYTVTQIK